jgi:hypothetical protein
VRVRERRSETSELRENYIFGGWVSRLGWWKGLELKLNLN